METVETRLDGENVIDGELAELAGHLNAVNARLVAATERLIQTESWKGHGMKTPAAYLAWKVGLSPERAKHIVDVAERRSDFPVLTGKFERGELSVEQIVEAVKMPTWADAKVTDFVSIATVSKIRRAVRSNMFDGPAEPEPAPKPPVDRLSFGVGRNGRWRINGELGIDDGRRIEAALTERQDAHFHDTASGDGDGETLPWPDALVECCERSLDAVESDPRRDRFRTWLHVDVTNTDSMTTDGWQIPMAIRDRVLCDGVVQPVWERDGVPFSVGRTQRIVPDRTRRIVEKRDRGCRVPGCTADRFVEIHHIIHWLDGGTTDTINLLSLCPAHHRMHHRGELHISGNADNFDSVTFTTASGERLSGSGTPIPPTGSPPTPTVRYQSPLGGRFDWNWIGLGWIHPDHPHAPRPAA